MNKAMTQHEIILLLPGKRTKHTTSYLLANRETTLRNNSTQVSKENNSFPIVNARERKTAIYCDH
jgi:hypothetical protein